VRQVATALGTATVGQVVRYGRLKAKVVAVIDPIGTVLTRPLQGSQSLTTNFECRRKRHDPRPSEVTVVVNGALIELAMQYTQGKKSPNGLDIVSISGNLGARA
jgi:hypothetical protein